MWVPNLFPHPTRLNGLGRGSFFGIPCPCPPTDPHPTHTPDRSPLKIDGNKRGGPGNEYGWALARGGAGITGKIAPPALGMGRARRVKAGSALPYNEH